MPKGATNTRPSSDGKNKKDVGGKTTMAKGGGGCVKNHFLRGAEERFYTELLPEKKKRRIEQDGIESIKIEASP